MHDDDLQADRLRPQIEVGRKHDVDGVLTVAADRAVPVVAAVAEELELPRIQPKGTEKIVAWKDKVANL